MEDSPLQFARPLWLYAGPVVCLTVAWLFTRFDRRRETDLAKLVHPRFRARLLPGVSPRLVRVKRALWLGGLLLLFIAAAGPRKGYELREVKRRGIDLLFAVDTSRSMLAEDLSPNRLERARLGIHDFISRLEGDRVGLVPFAGSAYALCPLTSDYDAFRESLDALDTDLIPKQGTDVASAINEAARLFDEQGNNHRILVLITDGEDLQGDALDAAREQAKEGMTIYPVGVGSTTGVTIPVHYANGRSDLIRDQSGNPVTTKLDEASLRKIAEATNGLYVPMGRGAEGLDSIYREKLRLVPKNELEGRMEKIPLERYEWPLALALLCLIMEFLLPDRRRPAKAAALPSAARRHAVPGQTAVVLTISLLWLLCSGRVQAELPDAKVLYNNGTAAYTAGEFQTAADTLRSSLNTTDLALQNRAYYNLGNALYRIGQASQAENVEATLKSWEEALKAYSDALALDASDTDARFNHDLVKRKLDELKKQDPDKNKDDQKKDGKDQKDGKKDDKEKQDGEKKDGDPKDGEKQDGKEESGEGKDGEKKDGHKPGEEKEGDAKKEGQEGDAEKQEKQDGKESGSAGEKEKDGKEKGTKEGETGEQKDGPPKQGEEKSSTEERRQVQQKQMTAEEAKQLLNMMRGEQRTVIPMERPPQRGRFIDPNNTTKGKTW
ncbi:MAG: VWA domain-containing protein [Verrucomicrobiota bacterium]